MRMTPRRTLIVATALAVAACGPMPADVAGDLSYEGLERVDARRLDIAFVRPGVSFNSYDGLQLGEPELAFRTPERSERQFPLTPEQKARFRDLLATSFSKEFSDTEELQLRNESGPGVLVLNVRVQDIVATIPPRGIGMAGRASIALEAVGEATLVLELRDSETNEILARAVDARAVEGIAITIDGQPITRWEDVERLCAQWAIVARRGLETLVNEER